MNRRPIPILALLVAFTGACGQNSQLTPVKAPTDVIVRQHWQPTADDGLTDATLLAGEALDDSTGISLYTFDGYWILGLERVIGHDSSGSPVIAVLDTIELHPSTTIISFRRCDKQDTPTWVPIGPSGKVLGHLPAWIILENARLSRARMSDQYDCPSDDGPNEDDR